GQRSYHRTDRYRLRSALRQKQGVPERIGGCKHNCGWMAGQPGLSVRIRDAILVYVVDLPDFYNCRYFSGGLCAWLRSRGAGTTPWAQWFQSSQWWDLSQPCGV